MTSAPAGWYPDHHGHTRYWDGEAWTELVSQQTPPTTPPSKPPAPQPKKDSAIARMRTARQERILSQAEAALEAGAMVTSGVFGTSTIEIYEGGYVRVASGERPAFMGRTSRPGRAMSPGATVSMTKGVPYERVISIKFTPSTQDQTSGDTAPLAGAVGPMMSKVIRGGKASLKGSLPGLAATGIAHVASIESRTAYLMITTDREVHQLTNQGHNGYVRTINRAHVDVGLALESAVNAVLAGKETSTESTTPYSAAPVSDSQLTQAASGTSTLAARLRDLAGLHNDGILTDEEFATAKARLLGDL